MARIDALVDAFNGQIKYLPMVLDHPDWTDGECVAFAKKWDAVAREKYKADPDKWNNGIPYARNIFKVTDGR
jgi:hypothetical protein